MEPWPRVRVPRRWLVTSAVALLFTATGGRAEASEGPLDPEKAARSFRLEPGLRADMVIVNAETRGIEATISAGRLSYLAGEAARRFVSQPEALRLAAE